MTWGQATAMTKQTLGEETHLGPSHMSMACAAKQVEAWVPGFLKIIPTVRRRAPCSHRSPEAQSRAGGRRACCRDPRCAAAPPARAHPPSARIIRFRYTRSSQFRYIISVLAAVGDDMGCEVWQGPSQPCTRRNTAPHLASHGASCGGGVGVVHVHEAEAAALPRRHVQQHHRMQHVAEGLHHLRGGQTRACAQNCPCQLPAPTHERRKKPVPPHAEICIPLQSTVLWIWDRLMAMTIARNQKPVIVTYHALHV